MINAGYMRKTASFPNILSYSKTYLEKMLSWERALNNSLTFKSFTLSVICFLVSRLFIIIWHIIELLSLAKLKQTSQFFMLLRNNTETKRSWSLYYLSHTVQPRFLCTFKPLHVIKMNIQVLNTSRFCSVVSVLANLNLSILWGL